MQQFDIFVTAGCHPHGSGFIQMKPDRRSLGAISACGGTPQLTRKIGVPGELISRTPAEVRSRGYHALDIASNDALFAGMPHPRIRSLVSGTHLTPAHVQ
jgi:hypothetical protein